MSLFKNNKNRNKVVNPYCSLGWLLIITIFEKCAKLKPPWVHLGKQNNTIIFFLLLIFLTKKWSSAVCGGGGGCGRTHRTPPPYGPDDHQNRGRHSQKIAFAHTFCIIDIESIRSKRQLSNLFTVANSHYQPS